MKRKFGVMMAVVALVMLFLSNGSVFAYTLEGDFNTATCVPINLSIGGDLWSLLKGTCGGIRTPSPNVLNATNHNWVEGDYVLVTGKNGSTALYSVGELDTGFAPANAVTLTLDKDKKDWDLAGRGRTIEKVCNIEVAHAVPVLKAFTTHPFSPELIVSGAGITPRTYDLADLKGMPQASFVNTAVTPNVTYTGPTLMTVLEAAGINTGDMDSFIVVSATDGYATVLSMYEATHEMGTQYDLLAISAYNGTANVEINIGGGTGDNGFARLVLPSDNPGAPGRWVSNIDQIVVHKLHPEDTWASMEHCR